MVYLAPTIVQDLEDWFLTTLRPVYPNSTYIIIGHNPDEEIDAVPYDFVKIVYSGLTTSVNKDYIDQSFNFKLIYASTLPATLLPHRRSLAMAEKGRLTLWEQTPPRPADAYKLLLKSEKLASNKTCSCGPVYIQEWVAYNRLTNILQPYAEPCQGANEPDSILRDPIDYVSPIDCYWYTTPNNDFDSNLPLSNGENQPWLWIDNQWATNHNYNPNLPTIWGNIPFLAMRFITDLQVNIYNKHCTTDDNHCLMPGSIPVTVTLGLSDQC